MARRCALSLVYAACLALSVHARDIASIENIDRIRSELPVNNALLIEYYDKFIKSRDAERFSRKVQGRYTEGTLQRLLSNPEPKVRRAALVALGLVGTMRSNDAVALCLYDEKRTLRELAEGVLWSIWFRAGTGKHNQELQRLTRLISDRKYRQALDGLNRLITDAPQFAEAYNQRAIVHWQKGSLEKSIRDCEKVLKLNPRHFGALSGMAQCHLRLDRPQEALKAFKRAYRIHPSLRGVSDAIEELEVLLGHGRHSREE